MKKSAGFFKLNLQRGFVSLSIIALGVLIISAIVLPLATKLAGERVTTKQRAAEPECIIDDDCACPGVACTPHCSSMGVCNCSGTCDNREQPTQPPPQPRPTTPSGDECATPDDCDAPGRCNVNCRGTPRRCYWSNCPVIPTPTSLPLCDKSCKSSDCSICGPAYKCINDECIIPATPTSVLPVCNSANCGGTKYAECYPNKDINLNKYSGGKDMGGTDSCYYDIKAFQASNCEIVGEVCACYNAWNCDDSSKPQGCNSVCPPQPTLTPTPGPLCVEACTNDSTCASRCNSLAYECIAGRCRIPAAPTPTKVVPTNTPVPIATPTKPVATATPGQGGPQPTPTTCPIPPAPSLVEPIQGKSFETGSIVELKIQSSVQGCGNSPVQYMISFTYRGIAWGEDRWSNDPVWTTGPYSGSGTATWKARVRYLVGSTYKVSEWTPAGSYNITQDITCPAGKPAYLLGNVNCDEKIDIFDFEILRREMLGIDNSKRADFNKDRQVDINDFEIWRSGFTFHY